jgi:hypothetical protein
VVRGLLPAAIRPGLPLKPIHPVQAPRAYIRAPMPPTLYTPPGVNLWVSWRPNLLELATMTPPSFGAGEWEVPATRFRYLGVDYFGDLSGPHLPLMALFPSQGGQPDMAKLSLGSGDAWQQAILHVGAPGPAKLRVQEARPGAWMALAEPVEIGRLSLFCHWAREQYVVLIIAGAALLALGYLWSTRNLETENPALPKQ